MVKSINPNKGAYALNALDLLFYVVFFLVSFTLAVTFSPESSEANLANLLTAISFGVVVLAFFASATGTFQGLKVITPWWALAAIPSFILWTIFNWAIFSGGSAGSVLVGENNAGNVFAQFLGVELFTTGFNAFFLGIGETIILAVGLSAFGSIGTSGGMNKSVNALPIIVILAAFLALGHTLIATALAEAGTVVFASVLFHQFFAFMVMGIFYVIGGFAAAASAHTVKNLIAFPHPVAWLAFILFAVATLLLSAKQLKEVPVLKGVQFRV